MPALGLCLLCSDLGLISATVLTNKKSVPALGSRSKDNLSSAISVTALPMWPS